MGERAKERFRTVFDAYFEEVRAYCLRRLPLADANDAVSEVFMTVWRRIDAVPAAGSERPWLFAVARNVVRNRTRAIRRTGRLRARLASLGAEPELGPETHLMVSVAQREVAAALASLRPADREVVRLRLWEELSVAETAEVLQINAKAAAKRYARALAKIELALAQPVRERTRPHTTLRGGER